MDLACCGWSCIEDCTEYPHSCAGCNELEGKAPWTREAGFNRCFFYQCCVVDKGFAHCGECDEMPCSAFDDYADPSLDEATKQQELAKRIARLRATTL